MNIALIAAAGHGRRMNTNENKLFTDVLGKPLICYALEAFNEHEEIDAIVLIVNESCLAESREVVGLLSAKKPVHLVTGGESRQDSVKKGMDFVDLNLSWSTSQGGKTPKIVLIHNGANPLVTAEEISAVIKAAKDHGTAVVGHPAVDTIKETENGEITGTLARDRLVSVQTPQAIQYDLFRKALNHAIETGFQGTDDVSLVERIGGRVKLVPASEFNFKITHRKDLDFLTFLLQKYEF